MSRLYRIIEEWKIRRNLKQALKEVKLHQEGKIKLKTWDEVRKELENDNKRTVYRHNRQVKKSR